MYILKYLKELSYGNQLFLLLILIKTKHDFRPVNLLPICLRLGNDTTLCFHYFLLHYIDNTVLLSPWCGWRPLQN